MANRIPLLLFCAAIGILAYLCFDFWSVRHAPLYSKLETQWTADIQQLEASKKLPKAWFDVRDVEVYPGTLETKNWLQHIQVPLHRKTDGHYKLKVLVIAWEENGIRGTLVQYDLMDLKTKNNIWELSRTYILSLPALADPLANLREEWRNL